MDDLRKPAVLEEVGGLPDEVRVWLALYSDDLDPEDVTRRMGSAPTDAHKKGDRKGERSPPFRRGAWLFTVEGKAPTGPEELADQLLRRFPSDDEFWRQLRCDYEVRISFGIHTNGW